MPVMLNCMFNSFKMKHIIRIQFLATGLAALALASCASVAQIDTPSSDALRRMSDTLAAADQLSFSASRKLDRRVLDNPKIIGDATIEVQADRPDRLKAVTRGSGEERHIYIGSGGSTIYSRNSKHYARFPGHATIDKSIDAAAIKLGIHVPMQDFVAANPYRGFTQGSDTISHAGVESVRGQTCDHLQGTRDDLSWDLWISQSSSLPVRYAITVKEVSGKDHLVLDFRNWNLAPSLKAGSFDFSPPSGAEEIQFLPPGEASE
jgi:hypothetical protein